LHGHDPKILAELREALVATGSLSREIDFPMPSIGQTRRLAMTYVHVPPNVVMVHAEDVTARRRTEVRLRFQAELLDRVDAAVVALDTEGTITHWNRCAQEFYGFSEAEAVGASISDLVARVDVEDREALLERIGTGEGPWEVEFKLRRADGEVIPVYARNATVRGSGGEIIGYVGVSVDISERQRVQEKLRQAEVRYRTLVERLPAITFVAGFGEASWVYVSPQVESMLGYTPEEWEADPALWRSRLHAEDRDRVLAETARAEASGGAIEIEYRIMAKSGDVRWVRHEALVHAGTDGDPGQTEGLLTDITERKAFESQLQFLADHDGLTGLFNRRRFLEELGQEVRLAERQREPGCVLMIDIDNFKYINDSLGHQAGDSLIRSVAGILERRLRGGDTLSRLGGDEFAVLLHGTRSDRAVTVAEGLLEALRERVHLLSGEPVHITASVGIAELEPSAAAEGALAAADLAMYEAKRAGRDRLAVFSPDMHARAEEGRSWAEEIRTALDRDRFQLYCQPIVDLRTGAVAQHELLLRMRGRGDELVPPASFLPMAERFDLVQAIDRWVVGQAVGLIGERRRGGSPIRVAVNLSGRSMGDPALTSHLRKELDRGPAEADDLVLEVAETAATANMEQARSFAERVARLGCRLSLDNFGSGFSSFYYLKYLPVNYLKIDGEFVRKLGTGRIDQEVVRSIVRLAGSVDTRTIAEFVGDQPTYELLSDYGVDYAQGFHVGAPRPVAAI
jgi:diguanylate cyclase (GGDEF)-like protein/PAS domain S-box-containing protein